MNSLLLLFFSVLPVFLVGIYIYKKDDQKEPFGLLFRLFLGGICSVFLTFGITLVLGIFFPSLLSSDINLNLYELFFHVFFGVALVEEFSKWIFLYKISFNHKEFDQIYDMIVYAVFVALGFACLENIFYVFDNGYGVAFIRSILAVPGHACDGIFMGYYLSISKVSQINGDVSLMKRNLVLSLLVPIILHGFYDFCLFSGNGFLILVFFVFIIFLYIICISRVKKISKFNRHIMFKNRFCPNCGNRVDSEYCTFCGRKNE